MFRLSPRTAAALAAVLTLAACGTDPVTAPANTPSLRLEASEGPFTLDVATLDLRPGDTRQLVATKVANGRPMPAQAVNWATSDTTIATVDASGLVTGLAIGTVSVSASMGSQEVVVPVLVDPCVAAPMAWGTTTGTIAPTDCLHAPTGRYSDYYAFTLGQGEVALITSSGLVGVTGVKDGAASTAVGIVFGSRNIGTRYRVIGNGDPLHLYVSGQTGATFGDYTVTRAPSAAHNCDALTFVIPGASFGTTLTEASACIYTIQYSPYPPAIGQPIATHRYFTRLQAGRTYTVTLGGMRPGFTPGLTIFPNVAGAGPIAQSVLDIASGQTTRTVTFTPATDGYYLMEVSSGRFTGNLWTMPSGDYTLSLSR